MGRKKKQKRQRLRALLQRRLGVPEASAVAALGGDRFLVADDERGVFFIDIERPPQPTARAIRGDLEGICASPDGATAYVLCERSATVWQADVGPDGLTGERALGKLPGLGERNRGWEGIAYAGPHWHDGPALLAVHQRNPAVIGLFELPSLQTLQLFELPKHKAVRKHLRDLNDLAVHPESGHVLLLSGRRGAVAVIERAGDQLVLHEILRIDTARDDVPEGLSFDPQAALWLVTDGKGWLRRLR